MVSLSARGIGAAVADADLTKIKRRGSLTEPLAETAVPSVAGGVYFADHANPSNIQRHGSLPSMWREEDELSLTKLRFESVGTHGRDGEASKIRDAWHRRVNASRTTRRRSRRGSGGRGKGNDIDTGSSNDGGTTPELVLLAGRSGSGKSHLAESALRNPVRRSGGLFLRGKFDISTQEPYKAFLDAFEELCEVAFRGGRAGTDKFLRVQSAVRESLGSGDDAFATLSQIVPNLGKLIGRPNVANTGERSGNSADGRHRGSKTRLLHATRQFVRAVCAEVPLVIFLDDLQWADAASFDVLENLLLDSENPGLLVVGSYRSNEVEDGTARALSEWLEKNRHQEGASMTGIQIVGIDLENLSLDAVNEFIADLLTSTTDTTRGLAEIVHRRTHGNVFFVIQFLKKLHSNGSLHYCLGTLRWKWNQEAIEANTCITDNVLDLTIDNLKTGVDESARTTLQIAVCLGSTFDLRTLSLVIKSFLSCAEKKSRFPFVAGKIPRDENALVRCVESSIGQGLLEKHARGANEMSSYRFAHDQIMAAAFTLVPTNKRNELQHCVGQILLDKLTGTELERDLFDVVGLLNEGAPAMKPGEGRALELAEINLRAGKKAQLSCAFESAVKYLAVAKDLLGPECWISQPSMSLDVFNALANSEHCNGNYAAMELYADEVLRQDIAVEDKIHVYCSKIETKVLQYKWVEGAGISRQVLEQLGVFIPQKASKQATITSFVKTKLLLRRRTLDDLRNLPAMDDKKIIVMQFMEKYTEVVYLLKPALFPLVALKMTRWSVRYGICKYSCIAFALYGLILVAVTGDIRAGNEFAQLAMSLMKRFRAKDLESRVSFLCNQFCFHWIEPAQLVAKKLLQTYRDCIQCGEIHWAMMAARASSVLAMFGGKALPLLNIELGEYVQQMKEVGDEKVLLYLYPQYQLARNLMGFAENPQVLTGDIMREEDVLRQCKESGNLGAISVLKSYQLFAAFHFGNFERASRLMKELRKNLAPSTPIVWRVCLYEGLTAFSLARNKRSKKWKSRALKVMSKVRRWVEGGSANCKLIFMLFEAEKEALDGRVVAAQQKFDAAISSTSRCGFLHDRALANQRVGELCLELGDLISAAHYLKSARDLYMEWGAIAIADWLNKEHKSLWLSRTSDTSPSHVGN